MHPSRIRLLGLVSLAAMALAPRPAIAQTQTLYGVTYFDNQLFSINTATGNGTLIGSLSSNETPFGLAFSNGRLYTFDSTADVVRQINPATGATVATITVGTGPVVGQGGFAIDSSGNAYLTSALDPTTFAPVNNLYRLNLTTGTSTLVMHTAPRLNGLAFGTGGVLYGLDELNGNLYTVSTSNGATTLIGNDGAAAGDPIGGLTFTNGKLYATIDDALFTLNTTTGLATAVNSDPTAFTGFASVSGLAAAPEPSSWAVLGLGVLGLGGLTLRVRRRPETH